MTKIKLRAKPIWHETRMFEGGRELVVAETPVNLLMRRKGTRQVLQLPWNIAYLRAATLKAAQLRLDKINRKKAVKRGNAL